MWIVEAANGERHIIGEKGLRILDETIENVTVLKDELGLNRECREVRRNAEEGEKIRVIAIHPKSSKNGDVSIGDVFTAKEVDGAGDIIEVVERKFNGIISPCWEGLREYVVLEKTDIVRINGERFRLVERKAAVGERVVIVKYAEYMNHSGDKFGYKCGLVYEVVSIEYDGLPNIQPDGTESSEVFIEHEEYRVLVPVQALAHEPLTSASTAEQPSQPSDQQAQIDGLLDTVANLARRLSEVERQLAPTTAVVIPPVTVQTSVNEPMTRDEIVEKAKADVAHLFMVYTGGITQIKFHINRPKRIVTALHYHYGRVIAKGIAECSKGDVFNVHIGKVIAARRVLGFLVDSIYVDAPQPTEPRVGDMIEFDGCKVKVEPPHYESGRTYWYREGTCAVDSFVAKRGTIIDDSRDGRYGEVYSE